ncbi:hypothetical protein JCM4814A_12090 [Streptomyces phaeofaciens JCM 4814]|uniref:Lipoprotein n=1 Tax=Streptomyces phaeofaciens TaxID=68254 RepID=A0A918LVQ8_9ACTN|nr:hypothetical protein [Streptomyces phaeofaciens]GGT60576.1 hypothetical protein GCM10010226_42620 [Streptomyces phaeofaciens]
MKVKVQRLRPVVVALAGVTLAAALTGCQGDGSEAGADRTAGAGAAAVASPSAASKAPAASASPAGTPAAGASAAPADPAAAATPAAGASAGASAGACSDEPPTPEEVDPDEIALFRVEELDGSTGKVNLVVQHGVWGCPGKDTDGAPFVVTGEDSRWAMDQAAYVTAVTPIVESTENQRIGVQELIDWVDAHPDSGLVFRYTVGADGAIHRLEQVFTP